MKRFIALSITALLTLGVAQTALAKVIYYDLYEDGNLNITDSGDEYIVTSNGETSNVITVSDGVKTYIVLQGVTIKTTDVNGISIGKNADVVLKLSGDNSITVNTKSEYKAKAGINVAEGDLTIKGGDTDSLTVKTVSTAYPSDGADGAAIGSDEGQIFNGNIVIEGGNITAESEYGAGIGAGYYGDMSGSITISGGTVKAKSDYSGAGIGSGDDGDMSGSITISGGTIKAVSENFGAGIGAGDYGSVTEKGRITIGGNADVTAESLSGLGIGSGDYGNMNGSIVITDDTSVDMTMGDSSNPIGIGTCHSLGYEDYYFNGSISILEHATVNMKYDDPDTEEVPGIGIEGGSETGTITLSTGSSINGVSGADIEKLKEMGILDEGTNTISVDPTPEPVEPEKPTGETYSLTPLNLKQRIDKAQPGETVSVSESQLNKEKLPSYILEALALKEDVTLAIFCEEFCILIPSDEAVADAGSKQFYTIDELVEMYE